MKRNSFNLAVVLTVLALPLVLALAAEPAEVINEGFEEGLPAGVNLVKVGGGGDPGVVDDATGENNVLMLTTGENGQLAFAWFENEFDLAESRVEIEFDVYLGRGASTTPADGGSVIFQFDNDLNAIADGGGGNACGNLRSQEGTSYEFVAVSFDIYDNGGVDNEFPPCEGKYGGPSTAHAELNQNIDPEGTASQAQSSSPDYIASADAYDGSGDPADLIHATIIFDNRLVLVEMEGGIACDGSAFGEQVVLDTSTAAFPDRLANIGFGASTGGANSTYWIDNLIVREAASQVEVVSEEPYESGAINCGGPEVDTTGELDKVFLADRNFGSEAGREGDIGTGLTIIEAGFGRVLQGGDYTAGSTRPVDVSQIPGAGPLVEEILQTQAWSTVAVNYRARVVPGRYEVSVYPAELYYSVINGNGQSLRFWDAYVNGEKVLCNWSAASAAGSADGSGDPAAVCSAVVDTGIVRTFSVDAPDTGEGSGTLDIVFEDIGGGTPPDNPILNAISFERIGDVTGEPAGGDVECVGVPDPDEPSGVIISRDFEDDTAGDCPADVTCNDNGSFPPQVIAGTAEQDGNVLRITQDDTGNIAASAVFDQTVNVSEYSLEAEFDVHMSWTGNPADGSAFFVREGGNTAVLGGSGGSIGIPGGVNGFSVEFDTWQGGGNNEPSGYNNGDAAFVHVGINNMSTDSIVTQIDFDPNLKPVSFGGEGWPEFAGVPDATIPGTVHFRVTYSAGRVEVFLTGTTEDGSAFPETLVASADVPPILTTDAVVGFCGGTGGATSTVEVDNVEIIAEAGTPGADPQQEALNNARELWDEGAGELYVNSGGPTLICDANKVPAPSAVDSADEGGEVVWLGDTAGGVSSWAGEFFELTAAGDSPNLNSAQTNMGSWDARGTTPGVDQNDRIFHFERYGVFQYDIPVLDGGGEEGFPYLVTLWFANSYSGTSGGARRFFRVNVEGDSLGGFTHCPEVAPGVANPLAAGCDGGPCGELFDPVGAAEQLYSGDPCNFESAPDNGVTAGDDPDQDGITAQFEWGNAAASAIQTEVMVSDGVLSIALADPLEGEPVSPDGNPKISGISVVYTGAAGVPVYVGNANCDGSVDIADAICILGFLFGPESDACKQPCCLAQMDTNDSDEVDISDAITVLSFLFGGESMIAPDGTEILSPADNGCLVYPEEDVSLECDNPCTPE